MSDGLNRKENRGAECRKESPDPFGNLDPAEAENSQHYHQLQEAAADVRKARRGQRNLGGMRLSLEQKSQIGNRNQGENQSDMYVEMLAPKQHIDTGQHYGKQKHHMIINLHCAFSCGKLFQ